MDWNQVLQFIVDNWQFFAGLIIDVIVFFIFIFKKKIKIVDAIQLVIQNLAVKFINLAESKFGPEQGEKKKTFVFNSLVSYIEQFFVGVDPKNYYAFIDATIEDILSTPQRKEI